MPQKTIAIIQARYASSRLPGKVLLPIAGQPMLMHVVERTARSNTVNAVVVATTNEPADDEVENLCRERGVHCFRGSSHDVLDRYYQAANAHEADVIVRITADCPIIDPEVIDRTVYAFWGEKDKVDELFDNDPDKESPAFGEPLYDFAANRLPPPWGRTYPIGLDTEVCTYSGLACAWKEAAEPFQREHVMPFFYQHPERFRILHVTHDPDFGFYRWTVDTPEDLDLVRRIFNHFEGRNDFSWLKVLDLFERQPELIRMNLDVTHKSVYDVDKRWQK